MFLKQILLSGSRSDLWPSYQDPGSASNDEHAAVQRTSVN